MYGWARGLCCEADWGPPSLMQKRVLLTLGVLLSSCLPAGAQTRWTQLSLMQQRPTPITLLAAAPTHLPLNTFVSAQLLGEGPARSSALPAAAYNRERTLELSPVEMVKTPFVRQERVTVVKFWGGRLLLGGVASTNRMENVLLGFSSSGGLPGPRPFTQGHPGTTVPHEGKNYGINLTFRLGRNAPTDGPVEGCRCLAWIVSAVRGALQ